MNDNDGPDWYWWERWILVIAAVLAIVEFLTDREYL